MRKQLAMLSVKRWRLRCRDSNLPCWSAALVQALLMAVFKEEMKPVFLQKHSASVKVQPELEAPCNAAVC